MGSINGTIKDVVDEMRAEGLKVGLVTLTTFRPLPTAVLRHVLGGAQHIVVVEKCLSVGMGGPLANDLDSALRNLVTAPQVHSAIAGLGGRPITKSSLRRLFWQALDGGWEGTHFLDLNMSVVGGEIERMRATRRSGPTAENILRELAQRSAPSPVS
jgi:pyruvate ferredoxin oxidoreductase alpha subunit